MGGRQYKEGLDYFELNCQLDDKIKLVQAEFGLKGFAVVVMLLQRIYGVHGYYCEWDEDRLLLFMSENGVSSDNKNLIESIVAACIKRKLFSQELFEKYHILTSSGIQKRYFDAVSRRECVTVKREFLLVEVGQKWKNINIKADSVNINVETDSRNAQRREKKSREEKSRELKDNSALPRTSASQVIEEAGFSPKLEQAVKEWVKFKTEKRKGYKETGLRSLLSQIKGKAAEFGEAPVIDLIQDAMANNWEGVHLERLYEGKKTTRGEQIRNRIREVDTWV